ncbi:DUF4105 domain-containing protein [Pseudoalteromonas sp. OOF1S-7]|uniref:lipoprotein N-acyltransferase Lnb domain-containing protein n=1 Tax=Pseudoalteromonas sp. OOF1S-7 TaxID=2917757 RepID=UPI001EF65CA7|nr:DUF4105 domain-containing protein [Pseudoalteromonas sp. OOF1S-7]MCG7537633.1 DUF4105 domain-containing protein [Pseudoalteromonas sp. OOF1S-7]
MKLIISCFITAFFLFAAQVVAHTTPLLERLASSKQWHLLLHLDDNGMPQITDPQFVLSAQSGRFSAKAELDKTLALMNEDILSAYCQFPARVTLISQVTGRTLSTDLAQQCPELQQFLDYVPFDALTLVFASEVVTSASSMMGHIFFKAEGKNHKGTDVAHSLAYFTEITTFNPFKLLVESTYTGMPGFFSVRPFSKDLEKYRDIEQRSLWQYKLKAAPEKLSLLQLHLWELKGKELVYYFQSYNCATMTLELLALLNTDILAEKGSIVSPLDVVKAANKHQQVDAIYVDASDLWLVHAMSDELSAASLARMEFLLANDLATMEQLSLSALEKEYLMRSLKYQPVSERARMHFAHLKAEVDQHQLNLMHHKMPTSAPQDSSFDLRYARQRNDHDVIKLGWLPAGHFLHSDTRQYLSESELQMGYTVLAYDLDTQSLSLDELTLYKARSLAASLPAFEQLSSEVYFGYRPHKTRQLDEKSLLEISGLAGKSYQLHRDILGYWLLGGGLTSDVRHTRGYIQALAGISADILVDSKFTLELGATSGAVAEASRSHYLNSSVSWFMTQDSMINLSYKLERNRDYENHQVGLQFVQHY